MGEECAQGRADARACDHQQRGGGDGSGSEHGELTLVRRRLKTKLREGAAMGEGAGQGEGQQLAPRRARRRKVWGG
jgi:hypothetical protein